jgi:hypothetical protein
VGNTRIKRYPWCYTEGKHTGSKGSQASKGSPAPQRRVFEKFTPQRIYTWKAPRPSKRREFLTRILPSGGQGVIKRPNHLQPLTFQALSFGGLGERNYSSGGFICSSRVHDPAILRLRRWSRTSFEHKVNSYKGAKQSRFMAICRSKPSSV